MSTAKKTPPSARASATNPPAKAMKTTSSPALAPNAIAPALAAPAQAPNNAKSNRPAQSSSSSAAPKAQKTTPTPSKPAVSKINDPVVDHSLASLPTTKDAVKEKEKVRATTTSSEYVPHRFQWGKGGENVIVTGTFDDWQQSIKLKRTFGDHFEAIVDLDRSKKILFKFVVDGHWQCSDEFATESDHSGNQNNILPPIKA
ncbi:hypothetical protein BGZ68_010026 [Mortierella alpina]|nr:hypothetical protein BGZ68_010026 [Mortierella alpina]